MPDQNMQIGKIQGLSNNILKSFKPPALSGEKNNQVQIDELTKAVTDLKLLIKGIFGGHVLVNGKFIELQSLLPKGFKGTD